MGQLSQLDYYNNKMERKRHDQDCPQAYVSQSTSHPIRRGETVGLCLCYNNVSLHTTYYVDFKHVSRNYTIPVVVTMLENYAFDLSPCNGEIQYVKMKWKS